MERILKELVNAKFSTRDIAEALEMSQTNVRYHLKKHNLKTKPSGKPWKRGDYEIRKVRKTKLFDSFLGRKW